MPTVRPDISARSCSCTNGRVRLVACARQPSSRSLRASAPRTGARPANAEGRTYTLPLTDARGLPMRTLSARSVDEPHALAARIRRCLHLAGGVIPGDHLHVAPLPAGHPERVPHGLQLLDFRI